MRVANVWYRTGDYAVIVVWIVATFAIEDRDRVVVEVLIK